MSMHRVITNFTGPPGAPYVNAMYFDAANTSPDQAAAAVVAMWTAVDGDLDDQLAWSVETEIIQISEVTGDVELIDTATGGSGTGGVVGEGAPTVLQALARWSTSVPFDGRILRGRTFIPGLPEGVLSNGQLSSAQAGLYADAMETIITDLNSVFVIWHRPVYVRNPDGSRTLERDGAFAPVVSVSVPTQFAVLRSRRA